MTSASDIQALFDRIAPQYDALNDWLSLGQHRIWKRMTVTWSDAPQGGTCLDLCCGSGDLALLLSRQVGPTGHVFGLDFAAAQLAIAQRRSRSDNLTWVEGDALALPFDDNQFDAITMGYGLRNVVDIPTSLKQILRVLKPGAKAAILDFHRPNNSQIEAFQRWYLNTLVVPVAQRMGLREEYAYLLPSLERFPDGRSQVELAQQAGFAEATHYTLAAGLMGVLVATKGRH